MIDRLTKIIRENTDSNNIDINENTALIADLEFNSLDLVNLACIVEEEFEIEIPNRAIKDFKISVDAIAIIGKQ